MSAHRFCRAAALTATLVTAVALMAPAGAIAAPAPFGHPCTAQNGVRFCPTSTLAQRVPSFDGVPLDVDVTLPATGSGPFPTIVMLHGWGGNKGASNQLRPPATGTRPTTTTTSITPSTGTPS